MTKFRRKQVFEGIKIADFCWVGVGPIVMSYLADHGATVIHIESATRPEILRTTPPFKDNIPGLNRSAYFANFNNNKYGVTLNLNHPKAIDIARGFVSWADIIGEAFTPGTMDKWGLGYKDLVKIKPDIIMFSTCQQGQTGPWARQPAYGTQLVSLSGFTNLAGWPDRGPTGPFGAYTDSIAPLFGVAGLVAALDYRRRTGKGQHLDLSQFEAGVHFEAPLLLDYFINGRVASATGNRCPHAAPHGAYPCRGNNRWCTIAVFTDVEWHNFCHAIGDSEWTQNSRFSTLLGRKENEDELDKLIAKWTLDFTSEEVMTKMQGVGVSAGVVQNMKDIHEDAQLEHRHYLWQLEHAEIGKHFYDGPPFKLSKTPCELIMPAPCLGEHNEYVYGKILGIPDKEFVELLSEGVFD
ncbi:MAG: succinyl-CoA--benzylsuccinate CoA-transferase [Chloroflexi bacterium CG23_combo_of_CG06-09_8_20_14_all_45_10]|nr:MAG: succinyl-CoA--benzylsuccinate CoA-transferase [Chloroflexi bacterium CG23_combo_of_CG06-09_8_20_14_all_45_10]